ncbi:MAG: hypothetical protein PHI97_30265 [Desulfobulbus sp.]|nr:hypothetical protein [Desulfobulbus sp.]
MDQLTSQTQRAAWLINDIYINNLALNLIRILAREIFIPLPL